MQEIPYLITPTEKLQSNTNSCQKLQSNTESCQKMQKWNLSPVKSDLGCTPVLLFRAFFGPKSKWLCCQCWWHSSCESDLTMVITFEMLILIISIMMRTMMMASAGRLCCWYWRLSWCECVPSRSYGTDVCQKHRQHYIFRQFGCSLNDWSDDASIWFTSVLQACWGAGCLGWWCRRS